MILVGGLLAGVSALALARGDVRLQRLGYRALLAVALPGYIIMRVGAEWIYDREGWNDDNAPAWIGIGYIVADLGAALLLIGLVTGASSGCAEPLAVGTAAAGCSGPRGDPRRRVPRRLSGGRLGHGGQAVLSARTLSRYAVLLIAVAALASASASSALAAPETALPPGLTVALQDDYLAVTPEENIGGAGRPARLDRRERHPRRCPVGPGRPPSRPASPARPHDPAYRWSRYDRVVAALQQRGHRHHLQHLRLPLLGQRRTQRAAGFSTRKRTTPPSLSALARRYDGVSRDAGEAPSTGRWRCSRHGTSRT